MKILGVTEFKAHCLELLDEVSRTGEELTLTRRGKPLVIVSSEAEQAKRLYVSGSTTMRVEEIGNVIVPSTDLVEWEVLRS